MKDILGNMSVVGFLLALVRFLSHDIKTAVLLSIFGGLALAIYVHRYGR